MLCSAIPALAQDGSGGAARQADDEARALRGTVQDLRRRVLELERERGRDWSLDLEVVRPQSGSALEDAIRSVSLTGYGEFITSYNVRHGGAVPGRRGDTLGFNQLRAGDEDESSFTFRRLGLVAERPLTTVGSTGFLVEATYGNAARYEDVDPNFDSATDALALPQALFTWRAPFAPTDHVDLTVGRFRTWFDWETVESSANWLVTRSVNVVYGTPVTHTGIRATLPIAASVEAGLALVNGWDEVRDGNDGKTAIARLAFGPFDDALSSRIQVHASWGAVEGVGMHQGDKRRLLEVLWDGKLDEATEVALDALWGDMPGRGWHGVSAYLRHRPTSSVWVSARGSWYSDDALGEDGARIVEVSVALGYDIAKDVTIALEYRHDFSRSDGTFLDADGGPSRHQDTLTVSFLQRF